MQPQANDGNALPPQASEACSVLMSPGHDLYAGMP